MGFPHSSVGKESACNARDPGLIPGSGRSPGERNGNLLQYPCLENLMDRGVIADGKISGIRWNMSLLERKCKIDMKHLFM